MNNIPKFSLQFICVWIFVYLLTSCGQKDAPTIIEEVVSETVSEADNIQESIQLPITDNDKLESQRNAPEKANWKTPPVVFEKLGNLEGLTVADIGAGVGYLSCLLYTSPSPRDRG